MVADEVANYMTLRCIKFFMLCRIKHICSQKALRSDAVNQGHVIEMVQKIPEVTRPPSNTKKETLKVNNPTPAPISFLCPLLSCLHIWGKIPLRAMTIRPPEWSLCDAFNSSPQVHLITLLWTIYHLCDTNGHAATSIPSPQVDYQASHLCRSWNCHWEGLVCSLNFVAKISVSKSAMTELQC